MQSVKEAASIAFWVIIDAILFYILIFVFGFSILAACVLSGLLSIGLFAVCAVLYRHYRPEHSNLEEIFNELRTAELRKRS